MNDVISSSIKKINLVMKNESFRKFNFYYYPNKQNNMYDFDIQQHRPNFLTNLIIKYLVNFLLNKKKQ